MRRFRDGELDILVTTAVVEVGIDVPNATVMLIEGADRFGLSHCTSSGGGVGRGRAQEPVYPHVGESLPGSPGKVVGPGAHAGRVPVAEIDLNLRGPGDFFGTRQSGLPGLRMARLSDRDLLDLARLQATRIMDEDPELERPEHLALAAQVARFTETGERGDELGSHWGLRS